MGYRDLLPYDRVIVDHDYVLEQVFLLNDHKASSSSSTECKPLHTFNPMFAEADTRIQEPEVERAIANKELLIRGM